MNQLSNLLLDLGIKKGDRVGVYLNRCLESAIAIYGIMNAGAAYVPIDPSAPPSRISFLLKDCGIKHLITNKNQKRNVEKIIKENTPLEYIIGSKEEQPIKSFSWEEISQLPTTNPTINILEKDLAYIMYTSGSTGAPKGIMHTHYSGLNYAKLSADLYDLSEKDIVGNHAPLHFDISTFGYFSSPLVGATTVIIPDAYTKMPASLSQLIQNEKMSVWYSVPLALVQLLQRGVLEQRDMSALRWVLYGGEPFPTKHLCSLMVKWPKARFCNVYGPAEVNQCTFYNIPSIPKNDGPMPLGEVWGNTEMLILNENNESIKNNKIGELLIRTATMMEGYWNQPHLTENAFYKRELFPGHEEIFYRTGDLVRLDNDGLLMFMGRKDRQIKTRGYRVELDEVEAVLVKNVSVEEAAVFSVRDEEYGLLIEAAVILKNNALITETELIQYMAVYIPEYAIPKKISIIEIFPRTSTGKTNYIELQRATMKPVNP